MIVVAWIFAVLLAVALFTLFLRLAAYLVRIVIKLVVSLATGVLAATVGSALAQTAELSQPDLVGVPVGVLVFAGCILHMTRKPLADETYATYQAAIARLDVPPAHPVAAPAPLISSGPAENDPAVKRAWDRAFEIASADRGRLTAARQDCAALLDAAEKGTLDLGVIDLAVMVKRNVPALVAKVEELRKLGRASYNSAEDQELVDGLVDDLGRIGGAARRSLDAHADNLNQDLEVLRSHIRARTGAPE